MGKNRFTPELIKMVLEITVKENLTSNVKVEYDSKTRNYRVSIWKTGVAAGIIVRTQKETIRKWHKLIKSFENYCRDLKKSVNTMAPKSHVTMLVLNDQNLDHTLLTITDGITHYDFMVGGLQNDSKKV